MVGKHLPIGSITRFGIHLVDRVSALNRGCHYIPFLRFLVALAQTKCILDSFSWDNNLSRHAGDCSMADEIMAPCLVWREEVFGDEHTEKCRSQGCKASVEVTIVAIHVDDCIIDEQSRRKVGRNEPE